MQSVAHTAGGHIGYPESGWDIIDGEKVTFYRCIFCNEHYVPLRLKHGLSHYMDVAKELYGDENEYDKVLFDEVKQNPLFDKEKWEKRVRAKAEWERKRKAEASTPKPESPKCPTCGSTNIQKISTSSKVAGAVMFGFLSKTARSQFKCKNCGYKW